MTTGNQGKFYDDCNKVRQLWGLRTSTFEQIATAIAIAFESSLLPGVDESKAKIAFEALFNEWTEWRATSFLLQARKQVSASITKWPKGNHYYVRFFGDGVDVSEKFNTPEAAQRFFKRQVAKCEHEGRNVINTSV